MRRKDSAVNQIIWHLLHAEADIKAYNGIGVRFTQTEATDILTEINKLREYVKEMECERAEDVV